MKTAEEYMKAIWVMLAVTVVDGMFTGYFYHSGKNDLMFYPLIVGFILVFILYWLINKRNDVIAGGEIGKFERSRTDSSSVTPWFRRIRRHGNGAASSHP